MLKEPLLTPDQLESQVKEEDSKLRPIAKLLLWCIFLACVAIKPDVALLSLVVWIQFVDKLPRKWFTCIDKLNDILPAGKIDSIARGIIAWAIGFIAILLFLGFWTCMFIALYAIIVTAVADVQHLYVRINEYET